LFYAPNLDAVLKPESDEPFRIAQVVALAGDFVELSTLAASSTDLCGATSGSDWGFDLHFFTEIQDLQPVLRTEKIVEFEDGTRLSFVPGVPVDLTGSQPRLQVGEASFVVPLTVDEIGRYYPRTSTGLPPTSPGSWSRTRPLHYGVNSFEAHGPPFVDVVSRRSRGDSVLLTFEDACGAFTLRVEGEPPAPDFGPEQLPIIGNAGLTGRSRLEPECPGWDVAAGVVVTWQRSGGVAGVTRLSGGLPKDAREGEGKVCFTSSEFGVCIASDQLTRRKCVDQHVGDEAGAEAKPIPVVLQLEAQVGRGLDSNTVYRIVRAHINEVRACYAAGLKEHPQLAGRVTIAFDVASDGKVSRSEVQKAKLIPADEAVPTCIAKAVQRWTFSKPEDGGSVSVRYPFELSLE
jgi:hypothetical protein